MAVVRNFEGIAETFILRGEYIQSNPDMATPKTAPPSLGTHKILWIEIPNYSVSIYHHPRHTATNFGEQTLVLYGGAFDYTQIIQNITKKPVSVLTQLSVLDNTVYVSDLATFFDLS